MNRLQAKNLVPEKRDVVSEGRFIAVAVASLLALSLLSATLLCA